MSLTPLEQAVFKQVIGLLGHLTDYEDPIERKVPPTSMKLPTWVKGEETPQTLEYTAINVSVEREFQKLPFDVKQILNELKLFMPPLFYDINNALRPEVEQELAKHKFNLINTDYEGCLFLKTPSWIIVF